ncbi:hypothetical protein PWT90_06753 [Aphanocladium album]|nr:hypothetical protein PWT90_06753 [Aphanocladium album]
MDILRLARSEGCMRYFSCRTMVELNTGCNHITCRCGAEFCYVCGEEWKTCDCEQWHEDRLLDRANAIVNRDAGNGHMNHGERAQRVEQERENLVHNHEGTHDRWRSR